METLGQKLQAARTAKKLTASEAAKGTRIKIQHIQAMERDDFSAIPAPAYAKGFIKIYAEYLELDPAPLIEEYLDAHAPKARAPLMPAEEEQEDEGAGQEGGGRFQWPTLPDIPWKKILKRIRLPKLAVPRFKKPRLSSRVLILYGAGLLLFLIILMVVVRLSRAPDEEVTVDVEEPAVLVPAPARDVDPPDHPLPLLDELPDPYLE